MDGDHKGQAAMDIGKVEKGFTRSGERIILERDRELNRKTHQRYTYAGKVQDHDYSGAPQPKTLKEVYDPHKALKPETFLQRRRRSNRDDDDNDD